MGLVENLKEISLKELLAIMGRNNDLCVTCGKETRYDKNFPVEGRQGYIEGVGQTCGSCYTETYRNHHA